MSLKCALPAEGLQQSVLGGEEVEKFASEAGRSAARKISAWLTGRSASANLWIAYQNVDLHWEARLETQTFESQQTFLEIPSHIS